MTITGMACESGSLREEASPKGAPFQALIIVARDRWDLWHELTRHFVANEDVGILLDRRQRDRRRWNRWTALNQPASDRRRPLDTEHDLAMRQFIIVGRNRENRESQLRG